MKNRLFKVMLTMGAVAMICACGDDSGSGSDTPATNSVDSGSQPNSPCAGYMVFKDGWIFDLGIGEYWVIDQATSQTGAGSIYDKDGKVVEGLYFTLSEDGVGHIMDAEGPYVDVNMSAQVFCNKNASIDPNTGEVVKSSESAAPQSSAAVPGSSAAVNPNSSGAVNPGSSTNPTDPTSSAAVNPGSSGSVVPGSSADVVPESSSSKDPDLDENGFPTLESYGDPPAEYTKDILSNGKTGWSSRYWDACKPHCSIRENVDASSEEAYIAGRMTARNCNVHDVEIPTFVLSSNVSIYYLGYEGTPSACTKGDATGSFTCTDMAPIQVTENLSYGYVAAPGAQFGGGCGKCFHLQFNGGNHANDVKETHKALKGKHMIVMASNIGYDVEAGQYDMLVPGGGVGAFNALSTQIGVPASGLGANGGGFLTECQSSLGWDNTVEAYQQCVIKKCDEVFKDWPNLLRGCHWFAEWYMAADNPTYNWEEVECPQYLIDHYTTTINTSKENNYKQQADWSTYKKGDALDTLHCWREGVNPRDPNGGPGCDP